MNPVKITPELEAYMENLIGERDPVMARMEKEAAKEGIPIIGPHEGMLLSMLVRLIGARRVLELGTAIGYSGLWLLKGTDAGDLVTYETDRDRAARARRNFAEAGMSERVQVIEEDAVAALERAPLEEFDAVFIDLLNSFPSVEVTERAFKLCLARVRPGGLMLADNALRMGEVVHPTSQGALNVARYNDLVATNQHLIGVIIPIRDGVSVASVRPGVATFPLPGLYPEGKPAEP
jgi:predicted O-methyltransferase YrrM